MTYVVLAERLRIWSPSFAHMRRMRAFSRQRLIDIARNDLPFGVTHLPPVLGVIVLGHAATIRQNCGTL